MASSRAVQLELAQELTALRQRCLDDPLFLGGFVLDLGKRNFFATPAPFQVEAAQALVEQKDFMYLAPRNHAKTVLIDVVGTIWQLLKYPDDRVLIACSTIDNAQKVLGQITHLFKTCVLLHKLFPEYKPQTVEEGGTAMSYTVPCRKYHQKEASIEIAGENTRITGRHYDVIRCSDLVVKENVPPWSPDPLQMAHVTDWFRTTSSLIDPTNPRAHRTIDGTRWHDGDLYGEVERDPSWKCFKKLIYRIHSDEQGEPIPIWKEMPKEKLMKIRGEVGPYLWSANYLNEPHPSDGSSTFQRDWFKIYEDVPPNVDVAITVDLAISERTEADRTAIVVSGVTPEGNLFVLQTLAGRWTPYVVVDKLFDLNHFWKPTYVGVESVAWQKAMLFILDEEMRRRGQFMPLKELLPDQRKERRAWPLSQHAQRYGVYVKLEHADLVNEFCRFPSGRHDDYVDALSYRAQDLFRPSLRHVEQVQRLTHAPPTGRISAEELIEGLLQPAGHVFFGDDE